MKKLICNCCDRSINESDFEVNNCSGEIIITCPECSSCVETLYLGDILKELKDE